VGAEPSGARGAGRLEPPGPAVDGGNCLEAAPAVDGGAELGGVEPDHPTRRTVPEAEGGVGDRGAHAASADLRMCDDHPQPGQLLGAIVGDTWVADQRRRADQLSVQPGGYATFRM